MSFSPANPLVIGTRGSPLALWQADAVRDALLTRAGLAPESVIVRPIRTTGDRVQDRALAETGGKGLFTKEIDEAQLAGAVHVAVHSAKDLPTVLPDGLVIAGYLERADPRDALISARAASIGELPPGAVVGSASLRRQAMLRRMRPDLRIELLRGNVGTRLDKAESGAIDATILALAGLARLGFAHRVTAILPLEDFLPAVGQGAIAIVVARADIAAAAAAERIAHRATGDALAAERAFLHELDGSCRTPIAGHARLVAGTLHFDGLVLRPDGSAVFPASGACAPAEGERLGRDLGRSLKARLPADVFA